MDGNCVLLVMQMLSYHAIACYNIGHLSEICNGALHYALSTDCWESAIVELFLLLHLFLCCSLDT